MGVFDAEGLLERSEGRRVHPGVSACGRACSASRFSPCLGHAGNKPKKKSSVYSHNEIRVCMRALCVRQLLVARSRPTAPGGAAPAARWHGPGSPVAQPRQPGGAISADSSRWRGSDSSVARSWQSDGAAPAARWRGLDSMVGRSRQLGGVVGGPVDHRKVGAARGQLQRYFQTPFRRSMQLSGGLRMTRSGLGGDRGAVRRPVFLLPLSPQKQAENLDWSPPF